MKDDTITNNLKQLLYSNKMLDNTYPEMNTYRNSKFLNNIEQPKTEKDANKSNTTTIIGGEKRRNTSRYNSKKRNTKTRRRKC